MSAKQTDVAAYCARLGLSGPVAPTAAGLETVQRAHRMAIGFENLDVVLGRGIGLAPEQISAKLVGRQRGGYCFEHNWLFGQMLASMGLPNRPLLARVWIGAPEPKAPDDLPPRTHTLRLVEVGGEVWMADAGFGAAYVPPLPLVHGASAHTPDGAQHRLVQFGGLGDMGGEWVLERQGPASATDGRAPNAKGWVAQYSFDLAEVAPIDLELSNHWTSTRPNTRFTQGPIVSIVLEDGFASLNARRLTMHHGQRGDVMEIVRAADWRCVLADLFRIELTAEEVAALQLF